MLAGLLQLENPNLEGILRRKFIALSLDAYGRAPTEELQAWRFTRRKFAAIGYRFPLSPVSGQWNK